MVSLWENVEVLHASSLGSVGSESAMGSSPGGGQECSTVLLSHLSRIDNGVMNCKQQISALESVAWDNAMIMKNIDKLIKCLYDENKAL